MALVNVGGVALVDTGSAWRSGPVRFFGPKLRDRDRDQSAFILEPKKTGLDRKKLKTAVLDQSSICTGLDWFKTGF